jgi:aspartate aminotransferase
MFSFTGLKADQVEALAEKAHIYLTKDGRISMAALNEANVEVSCSAAHQFVWLTVSTLPRASRRRSRGSSRRRVWAVRSRYYNKRTSCLCLDMHSDWAWMRSAGSPVHCTFGSDTAMHVLEHGEHLY